ncbi:MAG: nucleotide exchange factor GrpE [Flavobacteriales bacterium]|nr:nucleotide exchange factor GrpE [Flavobacteriales bacterium]
MSNKHDRHTEHEDLKPVDNPKASSEQEPSEPIEKIDDEKADAETDWEQKYKETYDNYLRLFSEFDNFRKRNLKERAELIKTAGSEILSVILPVLDDFDRALQVMNETDSSMKQGITLIFHKLKQTLMERGLQEYNPMGELFDADLHEAITRVPSPKGEEKNTIIDVIEKGYKVHDKVIRYPKVVVVQ